MYVLLVLPIFVIIHTFYLICQAELLLNCSRCSQDFENCCKLNELCHDDRCITDGSNSTYMYLLQLNTKITDKNCDYYHLLENKVKCGETGYLMKYGNYYCNIYLQDSDSYSDKKWQKAVRKCLQHSINNFLLKLFMVPPPHNKSLSCEELENFAFDSHVDCYVNPDPNDESISFCNVPFFDRLKIVMTAFSEFKNSITWKQVFSVAKKCVRTLLNEI